MAVGCGIFVLTTKQQAKATMVAAPFIALRTSTTTEVQLRSCYFALLAVVASLTEMHMYTRPLVILYLSLFVVREGIKDNQSYFLPAAAVFRQ